jgi:hypothetical protein
MKKNMELDAKAAGDLFKPKHVDNLDNFSIMELMDLQNDVMANIDQMDEQIQEVVDTRFSGTGGSFMTDLEESIEASRIAIEAQLAKINDMPLIQEAPKWQKFLDENLSPLQTYQNEIAKLNMLLADGSAQGLQAFALGSANAIAKLKQATGLGGPQQFASAVQAGSAAEFQVRVDEMGKAKNVQEEIRQLMEAAAEVEAQQLEAAREIATAIQNLPGLMPRPQAIAVAVNP